MKYKEMCQIYGCDNEAICTHTGIHLCERCRERFESIGLGVVYFRGNYHGVRGATYTEEQIDLCSQILVADS